MKFYGKSEEVAESIIDQFKNGDLPKALAQIFINRNDNIPSMAWSWNNQFIQAIHGTNDARGFKQWTDAGRCVQKGSKAFYILGPCIGKKKDIDDDGNETDVPCLYGFKSIPVFAIQATEITDPEKWEKASKSDIKEKNRLEDLPLMNVATAWDIKVTSYNGKGAKTLGRYSYNGTISLGVKNLSTWTHELVHAADDKAGTLTHGKGQDASNEIVAELGGAVLLIAMGYEIEADLGGAWSYVRTCSKNDKAKALRACTNLINRVCSCVDLIIKTAVETSELEAAA